MPSRPTNVRTAAFVAALAAGVLAGFELHPAGFEPGDRVGCLEPFEWPDQRLRPPRIMRGELPRLEASVGDVAASAARDADLRQELRPLLEQRNLRSGRGLGASDGSKKASRTTARYNDTLETHSLQE